MCTDKTGTLTEASLRVVELIPAEGVDEADLADTFGTYAASAPTRNTTLEAIHAAGLGDGVRRGRAERDDPVLLAPALERAGAGRAAAGAGAPEALLDGAARRSLRERAASEAAAGRRVLALASYDAPLPEAGPEVELTEARAAARRRRPRRGAARRAPRRRSPSSPARTSP